jgi:hypothetical protein
VEQVEIDLRALEQSRNYGQAEFRRRGEKEQQLNTEIEALRVAETEQLKRITEAEARLQEQAQARQAARARATELAEQEQALQDELAALTADEQAQVLRLQSMRARTEEQRAGVLDVSETEARVRNQEQAREKAEARAAEFARTEQALNDRLNALRADEAAQVARVEELKSRVREHEDTIRQVLNEAQRQANDEESRIAELQLAKAQSEAQARERAARAEALQQEIKSFEPAEFDTVLAPLDEEPREETKAIQPELKHPVGANDTSVQHVAPVDEVPWLQIDLEHSNGNGSAAIYETNQPEVSRSSPFALQADAPVGLEPLDQSGISPHILELLSREASSDRAAALADLAQIGGEEAFELITKSFDDAAVEVRNAAARALYDMSHDRAGSFTRALREATPERRRKIGAAIAGSGLAVDAINSLSGEGRERTYDAYSLLFLMAKSGEVFPLMQAISRHANLDVRLTSIKLLALSNQQQVLSSLRHLAAREALPPEVHSALMEAIYSISTQAREHAPSLA